MSSAAAAVAGATPQGAQAAIPALTATHPLNRAWTLWYDSPTTYNADDWELSLVPIMTVRTVEDVFAMMQLMKQPRALRTSCQYHFFQEGIKPMWEDPANCGGGKLWVNFEASEKPVIEREGAGGTDGGSDPTTQLDAIWTNALLALVGEQLESELVGDGGPAAPTALAGVVLTKRKQHNRLSFWIKDASDSDAIAAVKARAKKELGLSDAHNFTFTKHGEK